MPLPDPTIFALLWCVFALLCGGLIKGTLGIGTPLLTVPMLTIVMPVQSAVVLMACPIVIANLWQSLRNKNLRHTVVRFAPCAIALMISAAFGSRILAVINEQLLLILIGSIVLAVTTQQATQYRLTIPRHWQSVAGVISGAAAGLAGGLSSMFGPLLILYLVSLHDLDKEAFVGAISFLYLSAVIPWAVSLSATDLLAGPMLSASIVAIIPVTAGMFVGQHIRHRLDDARFHKAVIAVLTLSGAALVAQGVLG